jgi:uncharacterized protein (TIGR00730 family)
MFNHTPTPSKSYPFYDAGLRAPMQEHAKLLMLACHPVTLKDGTLNGGKKLNKAICVYSSSSDAVSSNFFDAARALGAEMARRGHPLVYGGSNVGLMGALARSVQEHGGKVIGVIPEALVNWGVAYEQADELIVTTGMRERKAIMEERSDAFVALPGGFGTLEEVFEILTMKQLQYHTKPIALLDVDGFYAPFNKLCEHIYEQKFAQPAHRQLYRLTPDIASLFSYLETYQPPAPEVKWTGSRG